MYHHTIRDDEKSLPLVAEHSEALLLQHVFPRKNGKKNTQRKEDSVTKLDEVRWDILCTKV